MKNFKKHLELATLSELTQEQINELLNKQNRQIKDLEKQLVIQRVTFCLPIEGDTFESWHHRNFTMNTDGSIVAIKNETIKYTQTQMLELWDFLTDRLMAN